MHIDLVWCNNSTSYTVTAHFSMFCSSPLLLLLLIVIMWPANLGADIELLENSADMNYCKSCQINFRPCFILDFYHFDFTAMPRSYVRKKPSINETNVKKAIEEVTSKCMCLGYASKHFGTIKTTLHHRLKGKHAQKNYRPTRLTETEEN